VLPVTSAAPNGTGEPTTTAIAVLLPTEAVGNALIDTVTLPDAEQPGASVTVNV